MPLHLLMTFRTEQHCGINVESVLWCDVSTAPMMHFAPSRFKRQTTEYAPMTTPAFPVIPLPDRSRELRLKHPRQMLFALAFRQS